MGCARRVHRALSSTWKPALILLIGLSQAGVLIGLAAPFLYRPLPYTDSPSLIVPLQVNEEGLQRSLTSAAFRRIRERSDLFDQACGHRYSPPLLATAGSRRLALRAVVCAERYIASARDGVHSVGATFERKVLALCAHREMMRNTLNQYRLQARTWGKAIPWLEEAISGDPRQAITTFLYGQAQALAAAAGWQEGTLAEAYRLERFGDLDSMFESTAVPLDALEKDSPEKTGE